MLTGKDLIDRTRLMGYSDKYVAERIGVTSSYLSHVKAGRYRLSPEAAALVAVLCGEDPTETLKAQTIENEVDPERREKLRRALFSRAAHGERSLAADMTVYTLSRMYLYVQTAAFRARGLLGTMADTAHAASLARGQIAAAG
jgi:transcriptional regulator with XRE-family HTH domain